MTARTQMAEELKFRPSAPTKTFVLEVHTTEPTEYLNDLVGVSNVDATSDAYLFRAAAGDANFWVDQLDERFWSFHTDSPIRAAQSFLHKQVESRRDLDWVWLPSEHLRNIWPGSVTRRIHTDFRSGDLLPDEGDSARDLAVRLTGKDADRLLSYLKKNDEYKSAVSFSSTQSIIRDPAFGNLSEGVDRMGRFAAWGDSVEFHSQVVRAVVARYRGLVELCEKRASRWTPFEHANSEQGGTMSGQPIVLRFSRKVHDLSGFTTELFAARQPFRLWGDPQLNGDHASIFAVDLHVGNLLRFDVGESWMRVYLNEGTCGNTVARLVSNLQHSFDSEISFVDTQLQQALMGALPTT